MTDAEKKPMEFWICPKPYTPIDPVEAEYFHAFDLPGDPKRLEIHTIEYTAYEKQQEKIKQLEARVEKLKRLILLTDPVLQNIEMNWLTALQWNEYIKEFPDEG